MSRWILLLIPVAGFVPSASACSIPVFRYALEHWQPDPFMVAVFHEGGLTAEQQSLLEKLQALNEDGTPIANIMVKAIDLESETNPGLRKLWELQKAETLPWVAVHAPARSGPPQRIIGGASSPELVDQLLNSPMREEVAGRLIDGDSVVWVLLESGDSATDAAAYEMLSDELARLQTTLRLPEIEAADFGDLSIVPESLQLAISAVRVSANDPAESALISMLLHAGGEAVDPGSPSGPIAFPLFGRGRVLYSLSGERLEPQSIEDACRFLTGACQCTVKAENPGLDLLMSVDWESRIQSLLPLDASEPPLVGLGSFTEVRVEEDSEPDVTIDQAQPSQTADSATLAETTTAIDESTITGDSLLQNTYWLFGGLIVMAVITSLFYVGRSK